jgi:hypothetical protein
MADVFCGNDDLVTGLSDCHRAGRQNHIRVERVRMSGRHPMYSRVSPKNCGLSHLVGRERKVQQPERANQKIQSANRRNGADPNQFPPNFVIDDFRDPKYDAATTECSQPLMELKRARTGRILARDSKGPASSSTNSATGQ